MGALVISATTAFVRQSAATNSAPWPVQGRQTGLAGSIDEGRPRQINTKNCFTLAGQVLCQHCSSSRTQGPANFPSTWKVRDCGLSWTVIRSMARALSVPPELHASIAEVVPQLRAAGHSCRKIFQCNHFRIGRDETFLKRGEEVPAAGCQRAGAPARGRALLGTGDAETFSSSTATWSASARARPPPSGRLAPSWFCRGAEDVFPFGVGQRDCRRQRCLLADGLQVDEGNLERRARGKDDTPAR